MRVQWNIGAQCALLYILRQPDAMLFMAEYRDRSLHFTMLWRRPAKPLLCGLSVTRRTTHKSWKVPLSWRKPDNPVHCPDCGQPQFRDGVTEHLLGCGK